MTTTAGANHSLDPNAAAAPAAANRLWLMRPLPPTGPAAATLVMTLSFGAATGGVLSASRLPAWLPVGLLVAAGVLAASAWAVSSRSGRRARLAAWAWASALGLAVFALFAQLELRRQAADQAVVERLFRDALPPYDSVGVADSVGLQPLVARTAPRLRVARIVAVVEEAPPPPMERHRLNGRPRSYRLRTETVTAPGAPPVAISAELHVAVRTDPQLQAGDFAPAGGGGFSGGGGTAAFASTAAEPLYPLPGQRVELTALLSELQPGQVAPGQYDAPLAWVLDGLHARATIDPRQWRRLPDEAGFAPLAAVRAAAGRTQIALCEGLNRHLTGRAADTLRALCWGDTTDLTVEDRAAFQRTGTVHLLAISGLHVYILLYLLFRLTQPFLAGGGSGGRGRRLWRYGLVAGLLWLFAALTGFQEPVLRAVGMFTLWVGARAAWRRFDALNALALCGLLLLFGSPQSAHRIGFQLSYLSVGLLCWWGPALSDWLRRRVLGRLDPWLLPTVLDGLSQALAAGVVALFATLPLTVYAFGVAPAWALIANLILIPLVEFLLLCALPLSLVFMVTDPGWPAAALQFAADHVLAAADGLSAWCGSAADTPPPRWWALPLGWLALLWAGAWFRRVTQPTLALGALAVRRRFGYPATGLTAGLVCCGALALSGRWLPPTALAAGGGVALPPHPQGWEAVSPPPDVLLLGRLTPCVVARPVAADDAPVAPDWTVHGTHAAMEAWALRLPDRPEGLESILRRPVARWRLLQAPDARDRVQRLTAAVWLLADTPAAREDLAAKLPPAGGLKPVLLVAPTAASSWGAGGKKIPAAWAGRVGVVVLLASPWRLLEADGQAWVAFGREQHLPVFGADAAAVWRLDAGGRGAWIERDGAVIWLAFDER